MLFNSVRRLFDLWRPLSRLSVLHKCWMMCLYALSCCSFLSPVICNCQCCCSGRIFLLSWLSPSFFSHAGCIKFSCTWWLMFFDEKLDQRPLITISTVSFWSTLPEWAIDVSKLHLRSHLPLYICRNLEALQIDAWSHS